MRSWDEHLSLSLPSDAHRDGGAAPTERATHAEIGTASIISPSSAMSTCQARPSTGASEKTVSEQGLFSSRCATKATGITKQQVSVRGLNRLRYTS
jgi:hypothetical protein